MATARAVGGGWPRLGLTDLGLLAIAALAVPLGPAEWRLAALVATIGVVGLLAERRLAAALWPGSGGDGVERLVVAAGLGLVAALAVAGAVHLLPGPMPREGLVAGLGAAVLAFGLVGRRRPAPSLAFPRRTLLALGLVLLLAAPLRLVGLGYSEFEDDEAKVLFRAGAMAQGVEGAPLEHRKGPGELLLAALAGQLVGRATEADARLPFGLIALAGAAAIFALGRALFGERAGLIAGLLWAINGFAVAFGRVIQYHSLVVLLTALAALCAWRADPARPGALLWAALAVLFLAAALLCGFTALVVGIPAAYLLARRLPALARAAPLAKRGWGPPVALAVAAVAAVALGVYLAGAWTDLRGYFAFRLGGSGRPFNNLGDFATLTVFYVSLPYLALVGGAGLAAVAALLWGGPGASRARRFLALGVAAGAAILVLTRGQPTWPALGLWALALVAVVASRDVAAEWKAAVLGAAVPLGLYAFLIGHPRTHWHELFPGLVLLAGAAVDRALHRLPAPARRPALAVAVGALAIVAAYPAATFLPGWPAWPVPGPIVAWYRPVEPPRHSASFGLPHLDGWKAIARLEAEGRLPLPYDTNEEPAVARWYLPRAEYCRGAANSYLLADTPTAQSPWSVRRLVGGGTAATATVGGRPTLVVLSRAPAGGEPPALPAEAAAGWFDAERSAFLRPLELEQRSCRTRPTPAWRMH